MTRYVPPQHGAWAMLLVPYLAGVLAAGFRWVDLPLLAAWLCGYLLSYFVLQSVKTRRPRRFRPQLVLYGVLTAVFLVPVLVLRPQVLYYAPVYAVLFAVNAYYAVRRRERALVNDLASVVQSCVMVFVVGSADLVVPFVVVLLYFTGTVLYVKTMIRERGSRIYLRASIAYHAAALLVACVLGIVPGLVFAALLVRAWLMPKRRFTPKQVGVVEIVASVLVLIAAL